MNWIETLFGVTPDGNTGATELAIGFLIALTVASVVFLRARRNQDRSRTS